MALAMERMTLGASVSGSRPLSFGASLRGTALRGGVVAFPSSVRETPGGTPDTRPAAPLPALHWAHSASAVTLTRSPLPPSPRPQSAGRLTVTAKMDNTKEIKQNARDFANNKAQRTHSRTLIKYVIVALQEMKAAPITDEGVKKLEVRGEGRGLDGY